MPLGKRVVEWRDGDVAAVGDLGPGFVGVDSGAGVVACAGHLAGAGGADGARAEAGSCCCCPLAMGFFVRIVADGVTWPVADGCVEGGADDGDII